MKKSTTKKVKDSMYTRCSLNAGKEIQKLALRMMHEYPNEHKELGIRRPSSRVAIDALIYWAAYNGQLHGKAITDKNNVYSMILTLHEGESNE